MTTNTTNSQAPEILAKQVAEWRKEVARLNDLIAHAEGRNSQAASINNDPEFGKILRHWREVSATSVSLREYASIVEFVDAKLAQAKLRGMELANEKVFQPDMDEWKARAEKAESRLAEIQRGVEGLACWSPFSEEYLLRDDVLALLQPQGQADTSGLPG